MTCHPSCRHHHHHRRRHRTQRCKSSTKRLPHLLGAVSDCGRGCQVLIEAEWPGKIRASASRRRLRFAERGEARHNKTAGKRNRWESHKTVNSHKLFFWRGRRGASRFIAACRICLSHTKEPGTAHVPSSARNSRQPASRLVVLDAWIQRTPR